jgi:hypothetical protein
MQHFCVPQLETETLWINSNNRDIFIEFVEKRNKKKELNLISKNQCEREEKIRPKKRGKKKRHSCCADDQCERIDM